MGVRPLHGLVSIAECASRSEADAAVARLTAAGIDAMVLADPAASVAPHLVTEARFSVLVRIAIADDAQQVLVRGGPPPGSGGPSELVHPALRPRPDAPTGPPQEVGHDDDDVSDPSSPVRPGWFKVVAWLMAASVLLPLLLSALRAVSQL